MWSRNLCMLSVELSMTFILKQECPLIHVVHCDLADTEALKESVKSSGAIDLLVTSNHKPFYNLVRSL
uniref:Uncharacterized protein n=1 Tax=Ciona intestinalis TaxID=7719 RepID=H2XQL6_CIOIN